MMTNLAAGCRFEPAGHTPDMRRTVVVLAVCGAAASIIVAVARPGVESRAAPSLRIAAAKPLTVVGRNFRPNEHVRVTATLAGEKRTLVVTAEQGRFQVVFEQLGATRCDLIRIVAVRRSGKLVVQKQLPAPACLPA
jgi:hypothetical protein